MIKFNSLIFCFLSVFSFTQTGNGFIHRSGVEIHEGSGKKVQLNGVNLGGWLLWEGWIWSGGFKSEKDMDSKIEVLYGKDSIAVFKKLLHENYFKEEDVHQIAGLNINVVRIPFNHTLFETDENPYEYKESGFKLMDSLFSWCEKYKVYAVLDLHAAPGGQNGFFISDPDKIDLWKSAANQKRTVALWYALAKRYSGRKIIAGFDLLNEPKVKDTKQLMDFYQRITDTIRMIDKNHMLILEGNNMAQKFDFFKESLGGKPSFVSQIDPNTIFSFHYYTWFNEKQKLKTLISHVDFSMETKIPMWCGEWGEDLQANLKEVSHLLNKSEYAFTGSAFWTWKKVYKDNNRLPVSEIKLSVNAQIMAKFIAGNGKKPTPAEANSAWKDFFSAIQNENCILNKELTEFFKTR